MAISRRNKTGRVEFKYAPEFSESVYQTFMIIATDLEPRNIKIALNRRASMRPEAVAAFSLVLSNKLAWDNGCQ